MIDALAEVLSFVEHKTARKPIVIDPNRRRGPKNLFGNIMCDDKAFEAYGEVMWGARKPAPRG